MATNRNALIRYRTIDLCLQNRNRLWTLDDLIQACSYALEEYELEDSDVSKRTTQLDIQVMRSDKLGYNAPIIVQNRKYYSYAEENYSITIIPITSLDLDILKESVEILAQFKSFSIFTELDGVIEKLEDKVYRESESQSAIIHLEKNDDRTGLHFLDVLYQAILNKIVLKIRYKSFSAREGSEICFHGFILKEYNNRWFIVGRKHGEERILTLALDRIEQVDYDTVKVYNCENFDADAYYKNTYGVTVLTDRQLYEIVLKVDKYNAPYILAKPFHHSQRLIEKTEDESVIICIYVHHNFEIERLILGYGDAIELISPKHIRKRIQKKLQAALYKYEEM